MGDFSLPKAVYILQNDTESMENKLLSLRYLQQYINGIGNSNSDISLEFYHTQRINQLILDNVLKIILNEDHFTNLGRRQMIRTELFLILANLLKSNTLFGSINTNIDSHSESSIKLLLNNRHDFDDISTVSGSNVDTLKGSSKILTSKLNLASFSLSSDEKKQKTLKLMSKTLKSSNDLTKRNEFDNNQMDDLSNTNILKINLLEPLINQSNVNPKSLRIANRSKVMKPRPTVLFNDKLEIDGFAPGTDPLNFIEQDRKLGYQKPRMWVPSAKIDTTLSLLPESRSKPSQKPIADRIVEEFLQMRALVSYVGDLVDANNFSLDLSMKDKQNRSNKSNNSNKLRDLAVTNRFDSALEEAMQIWTPLVGIHIPKWNKNETLKDSKDNQYKELKPFKFLKKQLLITDDNEKINIVNSNRYLDNIIIYLLYKKYI